jgi:hypothetical protein
VLSESPELYYREEFVLLFDFTGGVSSKAYQADMMAKVEKDATFVGDGIYRRYDAWPHLMIQVKKGEKITFILRLRNDGQKDDDISGPLFSGPHPTSGFFFKTFDVATGEEIKSTTTDTLVHTGVLQPGRYKDYRVEVDTANAILSGMGFSVQAYSKNTAAAVDMRSQDSLNVDITVTSGDTGGTTAIQPDLMIRGNSEGTFTGLGIFTEANQHKELSATAGPFVYVLRVKNPASTKCTITLKANAISLGWKDTFGDTANGNADLTDAVHAGLQKELAAGATFDVTLKLEPTSAGSVGTTADMQIVAYTGDTPTANTRDAVRALATLTKTTATGKLTLIANPTSGAKAGQAITLTANGLSDEYEYKFYVGSNNTWSLLRAYASANTATWTPKTSGVYNLLVWARKAGSTREWELNATIWQYVVGSSAKTAMLAVTPAAGAKAGNTVTLTASVLGMSKVEYAFYISNGSAWTLIRPYGTTASATWQPATAGKYALLVYVREQGSNATYQLSGMIKEYTVAAK